MDPADVCLLPLGLRAIRRHGRTREPSLPFAGVTLDGTPVLFLRSLRLLARSRVMMYPLQRSRSEARVGRGGDFS
jgi:hypothetical protein